VRPMQLNIMFFVYVSDASAIDCMMPQEDLTGKQTKCNLGKRGFTGQ